MTKVKQHKLYLKKNKKIIYNLKFIQKGEVAIQVLENGYLTHAQLESMRKVIVKNTERSTKIWIKANTTFAKTAKSKESRMGKGKGKVFLHVSRVFIGDIIMEFSFNKLINRQTLSSIISKCPLKSKILYKNKF
jgi:large subunit ribosomal protein L16